MHPSSNNPTGIRSVQRGFQWISQFQLSWNYSSASLSSFSCSSSEWDNVIEDGLNSIWSFQSKTLLSRVRCFHCWICCGQRLEMESDLLLLLPLSIEYLGRQYKCYGWFETRFQWICRDGRLKEEMKSDLSHLKPSLAFTLQSFHDSASRSGKIETRFF